MWSLASIAAVSLLIRAHIGSLEFMDFDEWQQVFMASAPRWKDLAYELNAEAHPPAFYLLLKALLMLGHSKLLYRCIALVPGAGSVVVIGIIARKLLRSSASGSSRPGSARARSKSSAGASAMCAISRSFCWVPG